MVAILFTLTLTLSFQVYLVDYVIMTLIVMYFFFCPMAAIFVTMTLTMWPCHFRCTWWTTWSWRSSSCISSSAPWRPLSSLASGVSVSGSVQSTSNVIKLVLIQTASAHHCAFLNKFCIDWVCKITASNIYICVFTGLYCKNTYPNIVRNEKNKVLDP